MNETTSTEINEVYETYEQMLGDLNLLLEGQAILESFRETHRLYTSLSINNLVIDQFADSIEQLEQALARDMTRTNWHLNAKRAFDELQTRRHTLPSLISQQTVDDKLNLKQKNMWQEDVQAIKVQLANRPTVSELYAIQHKIDESEQELLEAQTTLGSLYGDGRIDQGTFRAHLIQRSRKTYLNLVTQLH